MNRHLRLPDTVETIPEALAFWAETTPDAPAIVPHGRPAITYAALWQNAGALADALHRQGVERHDRVVLLLPEGPRLALTLLGTACAAIALPLSPALTAAELSAGLAGLDAAAAIVAPSLAAPARERLSELEIAIFELGGAADLPALDHPVSGDQWRRHCAKPAPEDIAVVSQSSGTTGKPKRVAYRHHALVISGREHRDAYGLDQRDRGVAVSPMTASLGAWTVLEVVIVGAALVFPATLDPSHVWDAMIAERPNWMQASAGFLELLARCLQGRPAPASLSLRFVRVTSAAISPAVCAALAQRLGGPILPSYSSSEAGMISMTFPPPAMSKPGSVGQPVQVMSIVDQGGSRVGANVEGEIWLQEPRVFAGYLDDPEGTAAVRTPGGWFRTGDMGYLDEDGFLFLTGRCNELINRGGDKIAPAEVDAVLFAHPAVAEAAAFPAPDERFGQDIVAAVVLEPGRIVSPRELRTWLLGRLAPHKVPRRIWFVDVLPRTASGKVQRGELALRWQEKQG
jgi:acyl-CoA synthetase (AMP-forming)/AMP-acid ligase II